LIERVLGSDRFLSTVSDVANTKVERETVVFKDRMSQVLNDEKQSHADQDLVSLEYKSKIEDIKLEVSEEIKRITEEYMKKNLETVEQTKIRSQAQDEMITNLKEKYQQMVTESEALQLGLKEQSESSERTRQGMLEEIAMLRTRINVLEEGQRRLNENIASCCKNISMIEISVEKHLSSLLESVMAGGKTGGDTVETFSSWLSSHLVARSELELQLSTLSSTLEDRIKSGLDDIGMETRKETTETGQRLMDKVSLELREEMERRMADQRELLVTLSDNSSPPIQGLNRTEVMEIVKNSLIEYDADKTGMFDYALETAGGSVVSTRCTETYVQKTAMYSIFGIPVWYPSNNPRTIIQPGVQPGECWAFKGSSGFIVIQLSEAVVPTRFTMEHISKTMSPSGKIDSAPREFVVYGLRNEKDQHPAHLGSYSYDQDKDPLQFFEVPEKGDEAFPYIELDILSNHGNMNYTCLYRFRVHGLRP